MVRAILAGGLAALTGLSAAGAWACSCALGDPQEMLRDADGAFVGTLIVRDRDGGRWTSILCRQIDPDELLAVRGGSAPRPVAGSNGNGRLALAGALIVAGLAGASAVFLAWRRRSSRPTVT